MKIILKIALGLVITTLAILILVWLHPQCQPVVIGSMHLGDCR